MLFRQNLSAFFLQRTEQQALNFAARDNINHKSLKNINLIVFSLIKKFLTLN